jgi:predicted peptidase
MPAKPPLFRKRELVLAGTPTIYRVYVPPDEPPLPVILFLHGAGESGTDGFQQTKVGIGAAIRKNPERFPAFVVFPQASRGYGWRGFNLDAAAAALDDVASRFEIDPKRVYLTGLSMGGYGTWLLALQQPERFAALVPVCGGLDGTAAVESGALVRVPRETLFARAAQRLAAIPQWVFHGDADDIIPVDASRRMVDALRAAGASVRYTEYANVRHNSWDRAYAEPELMPWLLAQRL